jgi:hypothetical protein
MLTIKFFSNVKNAENSIGIKELKMMKLAIYLKLSPHPLWENLIRDRQY